MRKLHFTRPLGSGAVGTVYLAELEGGQGFRQQVAAKVVASRGDTEGQFISRMRDEARLLGLLRDDNILKVLELVELDGRDVVIMEYVEGLDIATLVSQGVRFPPRVLAEIGSVLAGALHRAHVAVDPTSGEKLNVIHRDVKPANVMITAQGTVKLLDFGVARARFEMRESQTGQLVLGTLNYMAPEYIVTGEVTTAADIYSLGVVLWEAASGQIFGQPRIRRERFEARVQEALAQVEGSHGGLVPVIASMLAWDPTTRPSGAVLEKQLLTVADDIGGKSLRTWAAAIEPAARRPKQDDVADAAGLTGRSFILEDQSGPIRAPLAPEPKAAPKPQIALLSLPSAPPPPSPPPPAASAAPSASATPIAPISTATRSGPRPLPPTDRPLPPTERSEPVPRPNQAIETPASASARSPTAAVPQAALRPQPGKKLPSALVSAFWSLLLGAGIGLLVIAVVAAVLLLR
jgi:eukaryotic-like serine/threonine-protein kinase